MKIFDKIGFRRSRRPVGDTLEKGYIEPAGVRRRNILIKIGIISSLVVATVLAFVPDEGYRYTGQVGESWTGKTLVAPYDFGIIRSEDAIRNEILRIRETVPPRFRPIDDVESIIENRKNVVRAQLDEIFQTYAAYRVDNARGRTAQAAADSARYMQLRNYAQLKVTPAQWELLISDYMARVPGAVTTTRTQPVGQRLDIRLLNDAADAAERFASEGVIDIPLDSIATDRIVVRIASSRMEQERRLDRIYDFDRAFEEAEREFEAAYAGLPGYANIAMAFFRITFHHSLELMEAETTQAWALQEEMISSSEGVVEKGEVIIRPGDRFTELTQRKLRSLEIEQNARTGNRTAWKIRVGQLVLTLCVYLFFFLYLYQLRRSVFDDNKMLLLVALLFIVTIGLYAFAIRSGFVGMFVVPVAIVSVLLTVMFDSRIALFGTLTLALVGGILLRYDFEFTFATLFAGSLGIYSVRDIRNRSQFYLSAGLVFLGYAVVLGGTHLLQNPSFDRTLNDLVETAINSFLLIIALPLLWVFERVFDITTDIRLLELSDTNRPVLKELGLKAPGTLNHTLQVANLAEAAADRVGANALLTRVGALYHDIGKMVKPEYFVENQRTGENPHDQLKPRMSALIIASHVKEGLELGKEHNLPARVLDFISMHHGTSLIEYFYRRASDASSQTDSGEVSQGEYRYPGPKPNSRETGILMLADSCEAASRSLDSPTHKRLESLIDAIFKSRIEDGQLDDSDLTFRELDQIKDTFLSMLVGMYHVRVKYPDQEQHELPEAPRDALPGKTVDGSVVSAGGSAGSLPQRQSENAVPAPPEIRRPEGEADSEADSMPPRSDPQV